MKDMATDDDPIPQSSGKASGFTTSFSVKKDKNTGQVLGWEEMYKFIDQTLAREKKSEIDQYTLEKSDMVASYKIVQADPPGTTNRKFVIQNQIDKKVHEVILVIEGDCKASFAGLPNQLNAFLFNFTEKDIFEAPEDIIDVLITMYDSKGDGQATIVNKMPTEDTFKKKLENQPEILTKDPSDFYDIIQKLADLCRQQAGKEGG